MARNDLTGCLKRHQSGTVIPGGSLLPLPLLTRPLRTRQPRPTLRRFLDSWLREPPENKQIKPLLNPQELNNSANSGMHPPHRTQARREPCPLSFAVRPAWPAPPSPLEGPGHHAEPRGLCTAQIALRPGRQEGQAPLPGPGPGRTPAQ